MNVCVSMLAAEEKHRVGTVGSVEIKPEAGNLQFTVSHAELAKVQ